MNGALGLKSEFFLSNWIVKKVFTFLQEGMEEQLKAAGFDVEMLKAELTGSKL